MSFSLSRFPVRLPSVLLLGMVAWGGAVVAQDGSPNLPAGISPGTPSGAPAQDTQPSGSEKAEAIGLISTLVMKTNGGDEAAARALAERLFPGDSVAVEDAFRKEVADASDVEASRILGLSILRLGNESMRSEGITFLRNAASGGSVQAMEVLASILLEGQFGQEVAVEEAVGLLKKARQLPGSGEAHFLLGELSMSGKGLPKDLVLAVEYYRRGAEAGSVSCQMALHRLYRTDDPVPKDLAESEKYGRIAMEQGSAEAAAEMGVFYEQFVENAPNWLRAMECYRVAAEAGMATAGTKLAKLMLSGNTGAIDGPGAVAILRTSAGQGDAEACFLLGELYQKGEYLPLDPVASTAWVRIAAGFTYSRAENEYGLRLITGYGVASDPVEAATWFRKATENGLPEAMLNLGALYEEGVGMEQNRGEAARWYASAAKAGLTAAGERLDVLRSRLTPAELQEFQKKAPGE